MTCRCEHCGSPLPDSREWSEADDFRMADLLGVGIKSAQIAEQMDRAVFDVRARIKHLRLADGRQMGAFRKIKDNTRPTPARTLIERHFEIELDAIRDAA